LEPHNYYYFCSYPLEVGSIVKPGNWGRILTKYTKEGSLWLPLREMIFESVRLKDFKDKPSRLETAFVFESIKHATDFSQSRPLDLLYAVQLVEQQALSHLGGMNLCAWDEGERIEQILEKARRYWACDDIETPELITKSALRVIDHLPV